MTHEFIGLFIKRLFSCCSQLCKQSGELFHAVDSLLKSHPWILYSRLRQQLYADNPRISLDQAREEVLQQINRLHLGESWHRLEFKRMINAHAEAYGNQFLSDEEVTQFFEAVTSGPINDEGILEEDLNFVSKFQIEQLYPIKGLLSLEQLGYYNTLIKERGQGEPTIEKENEGVTHRGGTVKMVSPITQKKMADCSDAELWDYLNSWQHEKKGFYDPDHWLEEENVNALGKEFCKLVNADSERFAPETEWWKNITRPEILRTFIEEKQKLLEKDDKQNRYSKFSEDEWSCLLGVSNQIIELGIAHASILGDQSGAETPRDIWNYPRIAVARFFENAVRPKAELPDDVLNLIHDLLISNLDGPDLELRNQGSGPYEDWQGNAINSVRGITLQSMFYYAWTKKHRKKSGEEYQWVFDKIVERLSDQDESPAVFAIVGSNLRLLTFIFDEKISEITTLLLPEDRPEHEAALIISHTLYDQPMAQVRKLIPELPVRSLDLIETIHRDNLSFPNSENYVERAGLSICYYFWNNLFESEDIALEHVDRFFTVSDASERASTISEIASIFRDATPPYENKELYSKVMELWDRRSAQITTQIGEKTLSPEEADKELTAFINWLGCECLNYQWRMENVSQALNHIVTPINVFHATEDLSTLAKIDHHRCQRAA